jgi:hypothetical protein
MTARSESNRQSEGIERLVAERTDDLSQSVAALKEENEFLRQVLASVTPPAYVRTGEKIPDAT